jgi:hypothetical protein
VIFCWGMFGERIFVTPPCKEGRITREEVRCIMMFC